jgi:hypothetical protein
MFAVGYRVLAWLALLVLLFGNYQGWKMRRMRLYCCQSYCLNCKYYQ